MPGITALTLVALRMRFEITLVHGAAEIALTAEREGYRFGASSLSDSLRELLAALVALLGGSLRESVVFLEEPGEVVWELVRLPGSLVHLKLFHGEDWGCADLEVDAPVLRCKVELERLTRAVLAEFARHTPAEYAAKWGHPYPGREFAALKAAVRT